ncbi:B-band O-antigen polymerase [Pseudomonas sp. 9AZ]|uniref:hypothetical protein n=1 Tax=Pseudomonas sp. 9AZ TaxID=2653168 RepID=UPI0012F231C7|nr:hypothetical protein [Pseudomonas sp. 9AZ]VXC26018.1 B-band O-antigen polymerase [Pseudomonas sp. 9AZ]
MSSILSRIGILVYVYLLALGIILSYSLQLAEMNEYIGYIKFPIDIYYFLTILVTVSVIGAFLPVAISKPSDFFSFLYGLFVLLPYAVLFPIRSMISTQELVLYFFTLAAPLICIRLVSLAVPPLRIPRLITFESGVFLLTLVSVVGVIFGLFNQPVSAGFGIDTAYERRMEGRDIYTTGSLLAYLSSAIVNGFAPFLAFVASWLRRIWLWLFSLFCGVSFFYLLGLKAPLLIIAVASVIGYSVRIGKMHTMVRAISFLLLGIFALFLVEYIAFNYSFVADYFIRRALTVPPWLISAYFEFMGSTAMHTWMALEGINSTEPVTFIVGEWFLGMAGLNANTNAFIYQLAAGGIPMYVATILLVTFVFALLDANYKCTKNPALIYIGFSYAILLTEQAATTALVSSGIGMLVLFALFSDIGKTSYKYTPAQI